MKNKNRIIAGNGILLALTILFTLISNFISIGNISINLSLIPIVISGILYGPISSFLMGLINGAFILLAPSTSFFLNITIIGTFITCLLKSSLAGILSTFIYRLINKKNLNVALIISSISAPLLNTTFFILFSLLFFKTAFGNLISLFISINFLIEFLTTAIASPFLSRLLINRIDSFKNVKI